MIDAAAHNLREGSHEFWSRSLAIVHGAFRNQVAVERAMHEVLFGYFLIPACAFSTASCTASVGSCLPSTTVSW